MSLKYGIETKPSQILATLRHIVNQNIKFSSQNQLSKRKSVCIWGNAGLGKTDLTKQLSNEVFTVNNQEVKPVVIHLPIAQIEEAGDILGLPDKSENQTTVYLTPEWWPSEEKYKNKPVVLLIDDFNRADPRILNALMQVIQDKKSIGSSLAKYITIVLTGNEANSEDQYNVNDVDKAFLTRLFHITMTFDKLDWSVWASQNHIDERVISWVLAYPELVDGKNGFRTNPRSVSDFGDLIKDISNIDHDKDLVSILANGCMDSDQVASFMKFALGDFQYIIPPDQILDNWEKAKTKLSTMKQRSDSKKLRADIMSLISYRVYLHMISPDLSFTDTQMSNFVQYIQCSDFISEDMTFMLLRRLNTKENPHLEQFRKVIAENDSDIVNMLKEVV